MPFIHSSLLWKKQYESTRLALPARIDLISVPESTIPAVYSSRNSKSKEALLFLMFISLCIFVEIKYYKIFWVV